MMIIEVDGYFKQAILHTKENYSLEEIEQIYLDLKTKVELIDEIPKLLCKDYNMIEIDKNIVNKVDIVIDTDTDRTYKPYY
ncbi:hypothetical protein AAXB25_31275 [Paenibacillus lautus]|uniref:hypothetical protein n=1 Tax=Paenibacillus lautus TaxID=1401 RepID=UPI003D2798A1